MLHTGELRANYCYRIFLGGKQAKKATITPGAARDRSLDAQKVVCLLSLSEQETKTTIGLTIQPGSYSDTGISIPVVPVRHQ